jgi:ribosome-binding factor A
VSKSRIRSSKSPKEERKLAQLCAQVEQIISFALGEAKDERLRAIAVRSVLPGPDAGRLLVSLTAHEQLTIEQIEQLHAALEHARAWLRRQVAEGIHRKRAPELAFVVLPSGEHDEAT